MNAAADGSSGLNCLVRVWKVPSVDSTKMDKDVVVVLMATVTQMDEAKGGTGHPEH